GSETHGMLEARERASHGRTARGERRGIHAKPCAERAGLADARAVTGYEHAAHVTGIQVEERGLAFPERAVEAAALAQLHGPIRRDARDLETDLVHVRYEDHGVPIRSQREHEIACAVLLHARAGPVGKRRTNGRAHRALVA